VDRTPTPIRDSKQATSRSEPRAVPGFGPGEGTGAKAAWAKVDRRAEPRGPGSTGNPMMHWRRARLMPGALSRPTAHPKIKPETRTDPEYPPLHQDKVTTNHIPNCLKVGISGLAFQCLRCSADTVTVVSVDKSRFLSRRSHALAPLVSRYHTGLQLGPRCNPLASLEAASWALAAVVATMRDALTAPIASVLAADPERTAVLDAVGLVERNQGEPTLRPSLRRGAGPTAASAVEAKLSQYPSPPTARRADGIPATILARLQRRGAPPVGRTGSVPRQPAPAHAGQGTTLS
jgi:hypothetical protein